MIKGLQVKSLVLFVMVGLLLVPVASAQNPTGTLTGTVSDQDGGNLPGVLVAATSPNLQGQRATTTGASGGYKLAFLPPGEYRVSFTLEGFATKVQSVKISAAQTSVSDIDMQLAEVTEEIVVTSKVETISERNTLSTTTTQSELESLPILRTPLQAVNLAPGVSDTGPSTEPSILGSFTYENLYLINGIQVNENIRGQFLPLFIEDAIQETTTTTAGVSAEYGRFSGGVVNVITKSGGNQFSGSLRVNLANEDWISDQNDKKFDPDFTPLDDINETFEATFGGPIWKDKIWFFLAGRDRELSEQDQLVVTNITYPTTDAEQRIEAKATISFTPSHSLIGSYLEIQRTRANSGFVREMDLRSLTNREDPQDIKSANYTGILSSNFFIEAQYSERFFEIAKGGGGPPDLINGTMIRHRPTSRRFWSPTFCGSCEPELRNNEDQLIKGSYFLSTANAGSHDFTFGYDNFSDIRFSVNHQTGSDFQVWAEDIVVDGTNIYPVWSGSNTWVVWWPPFGLDIAQNTDFETNSTFVNDSWQLNDKWSFNLGVRYDDNKGIDSSGALVSDDDKVSPRLGMSYDVKGDGDLVINASYGTYVASIANSGNVADGASTGGALGGFFSLYGGPAVNTNCSGPDCLPSDQALGVLFDWYFGAGGTTDPAAAAAAVQPGSGLTPPPNLFYINIPGQTSVVQNTFKSQDTTEITVGVTKRLGTKGLLRVDLVNREGGDFYSERNEPGFSAAGTDIQIIGNYDPRNTLQREYNGVLVSGRYRFTDRFTLAGNYTLSEVEGNVLGEFSNSGPVGSGAALYTEYFDPAWSFPVGRLPTDQTHKLRLWGVYDILEGNNQNLSVSLLQNFFSGTPYGADGAVDSRPFVSNPGYALPPTTVDYWFTPRDQFSTDEVTRTDVALNYAFRWNAFGKSMEVFLQPEIINIFDEDALVSPVTTIRDATDGASCLGGAGGSCETFNPFTQTPIQNVHWAADDDFGQADQATDFQQPRTFRFSVGFRF